MEGNHNNHTSPIGMRETKKIPLVAVCGPTASGKTRLAVDLAHALNGEVVSADSMQIYQGMDIGTAKPDAEEQAGIPHHLLSIVDPGESFSLVDYLALAKEVICDITARGKLPILAGGTGLYIHSLIDNISFEQAHTNPAIRDALERRLQLEGAPALWQELLDCDPVLAEKLHPNNTGRVIRALEVFQITGTPMSEWQRHSRQEPSPYQPCMLGLNFRDRTALYLRIDQRVDEMLAAGLLEEVAELRKSTLSKTASQAIGYKELFAYLDGRATLEEATTLLKVQTRRYAKRQLTWLRRDTRIHWLFGEDFPNYNALLAQALHLVEEMIVSI